MTPLVGATFPVALLFIVARPGIPLRTAPGHPARRSGPWFKQRVAAATGTGRNILPAIRPAKMPPPQDNRMPSGTV